jgi:hypothetical protein
MVNIRTSKKRKSNYNRTRVSRRVKRGGVKGKGWFTGLFGSSEEPKVEEPKVEDTTKAKVFYNKPNNDDEYLQLSIKIKADYPFISDKSIANGAITDEDWGKLTQEEQEANRKSDSLRAILSQMKEYQIDEYIKLLKKSKPEYPYARKQTATDKEKLKIRETKATA